MKKGQLSPVFKYVFALIVGALFIIFFFGFAMQYKTSASSVEVRQIVYSFDDDLKAFSVTGDSNWQKTFPYDVDITFDNGQIISGDFAKTTAHIIFAPINVKGQVMYVWTKDWQLPFDVDNCYYITGGNEKYYFVFDEDSQDFVTDILNEYDGVPDSFNSIPVSLSALETDAASLAGDALSYDKVKFVFFTEEDTISARTVIENLFSNAEFLTIYSDDNYENGIIDFGADEAPYFGRELLFGAIFAEDYSAYQYGLESALHKFNLVSQVYLEKASFLNGKTGGICTNEYNGIYSSLNYLVSLFQGNLPHTLPEVGTYMEYVDSIEQTNKELGGDCPEVF